MDGVRALFAQVGGRDGYHVRYGGLPLHISLL
jgi:hypothetical protein